MRSGELLDPAFARLAEQAPPRDRAWTQELVYGTFRLRGRLDFLLGKFVRRGLDTLEPDVLDILRLGAYQILEMHAVPAYAAVSQSVEMTKAIGNRGASGLVNGVLQSLRRTDEVLKPLTGRNAAQFLSSWGSHPLWLIERWLARFGRDQTDKLVALNNQRPDVYLQPIGVTVDNAIEQLHAADLLAERVESADPAVRISAGDVLRALALIPAIVQDPAAALVVHFAAFGPGLVADLCAAPGGKAIVAAAGRNSGKPSLVVAADVSQGRLRKVAENVARLSIANIALVVADARRPALRGAAQVLIDAPCTGTGTFRRHPDGKWRITPTDLGQLVELQRAILDAAAAIVEPGGLLVYATCSLETEENEQQVESFLGLHQEFTLEPSHAVDQRFLDRDYLRVLPQQHGFDGAFAARLRRAA